MPSIPSRARITLCALALAVLLLPLDRGRGDPSREANLPVESSATHPSDQVADAVAAVLRATVTLEGDGIYGSGLLIDPPRGLVLTSLHVVEDMRQARVSGYDGRSGMGQVVATDARTDLALVRVPALQSPGLAAPRLGDASQLRAGEEVYAIGSPRKLPFTVSRGIVSYVGREMEGARYLQVDMAINDGNSGGPVLTRRGDVIAVMSFILRRSQGLSFALPVSYAFAVFPDELPRPTLTRRFHDWVLGNLGTATASATSPP